MEKQHSILVRGISKKVKHSIHRQASNKRQSVNKYLLSIFDRLALEEKEAINESIKSSKK